MHCLFQQLGTQSPSLGLKALATPSVHVRVEPVATAKKTGVLRAISSCINIGRYYFSLRQLRSNQIFCKVEEQSDHLCFASLPVAALELFHPQPWMGLGVQGLA